MEFPADLVCLFSFSILIFRPDVRKLLCAVQTHVKALYHPFPDTLGANDKGVGLSGLPALVLLRQLQQVAEVGMGIEVHVAAVLLAVLPGLYTGRGELKDVYKRQELSCDEAVLADAAW